MLRHLPCLISTARPNFCSCSFSCILVVVRTVNNQLMNGITTREWSIQLHVHYVVFKNDAILWKDIPTCVSGVVLLQNEKLLTSIKSIFCEPKVTFQTSRRLLLKKQTAAYEEH